MTAKPQNAAGRVFYQLEGQSLEDVQTFYFDKSFYVIC